MLYLGPKVFTLFLCMWCKSGNHMWSPNTALFIINSDRHILHAWLDKDYRSPGMLYSVMVQDTSIYRLFCKVLLAEPEEKTFF